MSKHNLMENTKLKICMFGQKRIPSREGGVEVVVEELATRMAQQGHSVTCYNRGGHHVSGSAFDAEAVSKYKGVRLKTVPTILRNCEMVRIPKSDIVNIRYREKMEERKSLLHSVQAEYTKAAADLETLKGEVIKTIRGESTFFKELLYSLIAEAEAKCRELQENMETVQAAYDEGKAVLASLNAQYDDIILWAEMYDTASKEAKK